MSYDSYISSIKALSDDLRHAGILDDNVYHSLFMEIKIIENDIEQSKDLIQDRNISTRDKYEIIQHSNILLLNYLIKLVSGLDAIADQPGSLLSPIGRIIKRMNDVIPKYIDSSSVFGSNDIVQVANGARNSYTVMYNMALFITDLIDQVFYSNGCVSILLNGALIALSELQEMNNEVMMQVFEELQSTKEQLKNTQDQLNKMSEDLKYIKERLGLSQ